MEVKRANGVWIMALVMLLVPVIYLGSYLALQSGRWSNGGDWMPDYRIDSLYVSRFYEPAHQVDRLIRPEYWHRKPTPDPGVW